MRDAPGGQRATPFGNPRGFERVAVPGLGHLRHGIVPRSQLVATGRKCRRGRVESDSSDRGWGKAGLVRSNLGGRSRQLPRLAGWVSGRVSVTFVSYQHDITIIFRCDFQKCPQKCPRPQFVVRCRKNSRAGPGAQDTGSERRTATKKGPPHEGRPAVSRRLRRRYFF